MSTQNTLISHHTIGITLGLGNSDQSTLKITSTGGVFSNRIDLSSSSPDVCLLNLGTLWSAVNIQTEEAINFSSGATIINKNFICSTALQTIYLHNGAGVCR